MVQIITDTTSGLAARIGQRDGIPVIPQVITFGSASYLEGIEIDNATFIDKLRSSAELPMTAAPPPELFRAEFERLISLGEPILCIHPSAEVSGTVRSATIAAREYPMADIRIIDTRLIGSPLATLVNLAARWAEEGQDGDTIQSRVLEMSARGQLYFMVDTLEYLVKGGRIGGAAGLLGSLLQVKPILALRDGRVDQFERVRTHKRALLRLKELVAERICGPAEGYPSVMHSAVPDEAQSLAQDLQASLGCPEVPILDVPPAIVTHGGPGLLAVAFFARGGL
ncbi:MAG: DegV family protein [Anaerolineae bacterium]